METPQFVRRHIHAAYVLLFFSSFAFSQDILWEKSFGGKHSEFLTDAIPTADYGFILAGSSLSGKTGNKTQPNMGNLDYCIWKMDESGELKWQKNFGGTGNDLLQGIRITSDGGFILAGNSNSNTAGDKKADSHGGDDFWIIKLDANGGEQWQATIGGDGQEKLQAISQTKDGGYIVGGTSSSDISGDKKLRNYGNTDYWIVKLDKDGGIQWQKAFGGNFMDEVRSIVATNDRGYLVGGYSNSGLSGNKSDKNEGVGDYWIIKLDVNGEILWQKTLGGDGDDQLYVVHQTHDGNYIAGGSSNSNASFNKSVGNGSGTDFWIVKLNDGGDVLWQQTYDIGKTDILSSLTENKDHTLLIGGYAQSEIAATDKSKDDKGINDYVAIKITENGDELWRKEVGSAGEDVLRKLVETRDGGYILAGTSNPVNTNKYYRQNSKTAGPVKMGNGNAASKPLGQATDSVNESIAEAKDEINGAINGQTQKATQKINDAVGPGKDSALQYGINNPNNPIGKTPAMGSGNSGDLLGNMLPDANQKPALPASGDKARNFGNNDFWVVKLKDKDKPTKVKSAVEAMPNPTDGFTNVIVGHDYEQGTATVVDLAGHILEQFEINDRTIPIDLSKYPEGIYLVNIKTDKRNDGIKVIKRGNN